MIAVMALPSSALGQGEQEDLTFVSSYPLSRGQGGLQIGGGDAGSEATVEFDAAAQGYVVTDRAGIGPPYAGSACHAVSAETVRCRRFSDLILAFLGDGDDDLMIAAGVDAKATVVTEEDDDTIKASGGSLRHRTSTGCCAESREKSVARPRQAPARTAGYTAAPVSKPPSPQGSLSGPGKRGGVGQRGEHPAPARR